MQSKKQSKYDFLKALFTIFLGLIVLGGFIVALGGYWFWEDLDTYYARFDNIRDLDTGRTVKYEGLSVGRVTEITVDPEHPNVLVVSFGVKKEFTLYEGTKASITQKGLVGDNYLLLTLNGDVGGKLEPGATLPTKPTPTLNELGATIGGFIEEIRPKFNRVADGLERLVSEQNTENVREVLFEADRLMQQGNELIAMLRTEFEGIGPEAKSTLKIASNTLDKGGVVLDNVDKNFALLSTDLRAQIQSVSDSINMLSSQLQQSLNVDQPKLERLLDEIYAMARDIRLLSRSLRERPYEVIYPPEPKP